MFGRQLLKCLLSKFKDPSFSQHPWNEPRAAMYSLNWQEEPWTCWPGSLVEFRGFKLGEKLSQKIRWSMIAEDS